MRGCRMLVAAAAVAAIFVASPLLAQQPPPAVAAALPPTPDQIKQELESIKKLRTMRIFPAEGADDSGGATLMSVDNASPFVMVVLVVGPTIERFELGPARMQTLTLEPGDYELAFTVVGRDLPPFYGTQKVEANRFFRHKFVVPTE